MKDTILGVGGLLAVMLGVCGFLAVMALSLFYMYAGFQGISAFAGVGWAWAAAALFLFLRIGFPFTFGAFYCAWQVWDWHWSLAVVFALPGLLVLIPSLVAMVMEFAIRLLPRRA